MLTEHEIKELLTDIFEGQVTPENLPVDLYMAIGSFLEKGLLEGAGGKLASFEGKDLELIQELRTNIYMFSAAKTYEEVRTIGEMLYDDEDKIRPFKEFFEEARKTYDTYNVDYAKTEYNTAVASGQMGVRWNQIMADADILPYLQISVVEDAQTTEICEPLNGITLPIKDPFWDEFYPPNHWNCRSTVLQLDEANISSKAEVKEATKHADEDMQDVFKMNVGKDGYVFSPEHPYFTNAPKELGRENFGLPLPQGIEGHEFEPKILKDWGVKLDNRVFDLLKKPIVAKETDKGAYAVLINDSIHINITGPRWKGSEYYKERVLYHEIGHIVHSQQGIIDAFGHVSENYANHFKSLKKMITNEKAELIYREFNKINLAIYKKDIVKLDEYITKYGAENKSALQEMVAASADSLMALTNSKYGYGHTKAYMKSKGNKEMEMFAHSMENFFGGNNVFKETMPDVYQESKLFIKNLLK
jgi:SPP1 gp7 family putative phage head morphogenesis protein